MRPYLARFSAQFRMLLQYREAALAGLATQFFWGVIRIMIFDAFYRTTTAAQPLTFEQTVSYVWLGQALFHLTPYRLDNELVQSIRSGDVVYQMLRPVSVYWSWFARGLALRTAPTLLRALPMFLITIPFFGLELPVSWAAFGAFMLSIVGAALLSAALTTLASTVSVWTISGNGISMLLLGSVALFSGSLVPLPLMPDWAQGILNFLPFRGIADVPFRLWIGDLAASEVFALLGQQLIWTLAIAFISQLILKHGLKRMVIQGG